jgi:polar amino acid transport system substrate-binding protein
MTKRLLAAALLAGLSLGSGAALAQQTVRIGTEGAYPPYNLINDKGEIDGYERELGDELCRRAGLTCTWVKNDWDSIIPNLVSGNYDAIMAGMSITDEREAVIDFTQNYLLSEPSAYMALSADADIEGGVIAAQTGTIQASHVTTTGAQLVEFATPDETVAAVRNGEADAVLADKAYLEPIVAESGGEFVWAGEDVILGEGIGIGLRESDDELRAKFDRAIDEMKADGSINMLIVKWFKESARTY